MMAAWTRVEPGTVLDGIATGDKFLSDGHEFTVHHIDPDGAILAWRPLGADEDFERSYASRKLERVEA